jgi:hypothetical protein
MTFHATRYFGFNIDGQRKPGQYWPCIAVGDDSPNYAIVYCPECGKPFSLNNHQISVDGVVQPMAQCPNTYSFTRGEECHFPNAYYGKKCEWSGMIILDGLETIGADPFVIKERTHAQA